MAYFKETIIGLLFILTISCEKKEFDRQYLLPVDSILDTESTYIAILGDIQSYTYSEDYMPFLEYTMNWLRSQKRHGKNVVCILQDGDVTNGNTSVEWQRFNRVTETAAEEILYVASTGNHDYDWDKDNKIIGRRTTHISKYASFPLTLSKIEACYESGRIENMVIHNEIYGSRYDILVLEFGPRKEVLKWAQDYVSSHPDHNFLLLTHEYLTSEGKRITNDSHAELQLKNTTWSVPEDIWQKLVKNNDNIVCVLCGHNGFSSQLFTTNSFGREVPQILFNLQFLENGGDGWIQLWEFPPQSDTVNVSVYNTIRREIHPDKSTKFKFRYRY